MPGDDEPGVLDRRERLLAELREKMVREQIERPWRDDRPSVNSPRVLAAMREVPRHEFVDLEDPRSAYEDRPQPIGWGQTISQPYMVALMTQLLDPQPTDVVLEVGTGSGYQAAVLSLLCREVVTIESVPELADSAQERLLALGYRNVRVVHGDGVYGCSAYCPYDKIMVTAAGADTPDALVEQLMPGGKLVLPIGERPDTQRLWLMTKRADGSLDRKAVMSVRFVPLITSED